MDRLINSASQILSEYLSRNVPTPTKILCPEQTMLLSDTSVLAVVLTSAVVGLSGLMYGLHNKVSLVELQKTISDSKSVDQHLFRTLFPDDPDSSDNTDSPDESSSDNEGLFENVAL